jgi:16S rRNA (guanine966-N2)-methyltransferase
MLRIIGGTFRGRKIEQPELDTVRPTKDRIREAIFNVIAEAIPDANVLDLFAGSGAFGLEALSREAQKAVFIEKDPRCAKVIGKNIATLGVEGRSEVITSDVSAWLEKEGGKKAFDIVFADPPYNIGMARNILNMINRYDILNHSGILVIEHHGQEALPAAEGAFTLLKCKTYADISVSFYKKNG